MKSKEADLGEDIKAVQQEIEKIEAAIDQGSSYTGITDPTRLFDMNKLLREKKKNLLIEKTNQLRASILEEKQKPTVPGELILFLDLKVVSRWFGGPLWVVILLDG